MTRAADVQARREMLHSLLRIIHGDQLAETRYFPNLRLCVAVLKDGDMRSYNDHGEPTDQVIRSKALQPDRKGDLK